MTGSAQHTRARIIDAAHAVFWREGFVRASLDDIADAADVTKRTVYQHFRSKDDLMAAVLMQASELSVARLATYFDRPGDDPAVFIESLFIEVADWAAKPRFAGAGFTRVAIELADLPGHPARTVARQHKRKFESMFADRFRRSALPAPVELAREISLLLEGAMTLMLIHGDREYGLAAAALARRLVAESSANAMTKPSGTGLKRARNASSERLRSPGRAARA